MRIHYLHQYFKTPAEGGALRSYYLSTSMAAAGHEVILITAHDRPEKTVRQIEGVTVHYLPVQYSNHFNFWQRGWSFIKFLLQSTWLSLRLPKPDLVYASSTPLTIGIPALAMRLLRGMPYIFEVRDLWPEAPIQLGVIRNKALIWLLRRLEKTLYQKARLLIALSPGMEAGVKAAAPEAQVLIVSNMADCDFYRPTQKPDYYKDWKVIDRFVTVYTGALGIANRVDFLLELAAASLSIDERTLFLIAGTGAEAAILQKKASELQLRNVFFLGKLNREEIRELLQAADATYTSFDQHPILETNSPNKFFDSLAAGKISFVNTKGWLKELVELHDCGYYLPPMEPREAAKLVSDLVKNNERINELKANARQLAEVHFSKNALCEKIVTHLSNQVSKQ